MYSILKTSKQVLHHKKCQPITTSIFLTNNHIFFGFTDATFSIYSLYLSSPQPETLLHEGHTAQPVTDAKRLSETYSALLCSHASNVYLLEFEPDLTEKTANV
jgi:hypothetical protein